MNTIYKKDGLQFRAAIGDRVCMVRSDLFTAKTFVLKTLQEARFNGFRYVYYGWKNYNTINWNGGSLYDRYSIVVFDDADLYISEIIRGLPTFKSYVIVVASAVSLSAVSKKNIKAVQYGVYTEGCTFSLNPTPMKCAYCGGTFDYSQLTVDHMIPQNFCNTFMPGAAIKEHYKNKVRVCFTCNRDKSDDILIPNYRADGWMKNMLPEQIGNYSEIFVELLDAQYENVVNWIYAKNMCSHVRYKIEYATARKIIEDEMELFLNRYIDRKPGNYWVLI